MNNVKSAVIKIRNAKANWTNPGSFGDHLLEDVEHRLETVRVRFVEEERKALRDAAEDINFALVRESMTGSPDAKALLTLRTEISNMAVAI